MSHENAEILRRFYESWGRRDFDAALECANADVEFDWSESRAPFRGIYKGHEGLAQYATEVQEAWEQFSLEVDEVIECDREQLITVTTVRGRGKGSGIEIEARGAMLWTLRRGKILRGKLFQSKTDALEAARQSEDTQPA